MARRACRMIDYLQYNLRPNVKIVVDVSLLTEARGFRPQKANKLFWHILFSMYKGWKPSILLTCLKNIYGNSQIFTKI
jgi:hypothetical protein